MPKYPHAIQTLIECFRHLPGVGQKTAERYAFSVLSWDEKQQTEFSNHLGVIHSKITTCETCGCYTEENECFFCQNQQNTAPALLVVAFPKEVYALEGLSGFQGKFHVLGGLLSPLDGITPEDLSMDTLMQRIEADSIEELILALDSTIEGDATALYIKELLREYPIKVTKFAHGMPIGSHLEYIDQHTLFQAFAGRQGV